MFALIPNRLLKNLRRNIRLPAYSNARSCFSTSTLLQSGNKGCENSFTVSYLIESCGLSLQDAIAASKKIVLLTPDAPNSVLAVLREQGFSSTHISELVRKLPRVLLSEPEKTLLPKVDFLRSIGISGSDLTRILLKQPLIFMRSLKNQLIPCYNFLKSVVSTDEMVAKSLKASPMMLRMNLQLRPIPNLALLREFKVPESSILLLVSNFPETTMIKHEKFVERVEFLKSMGFDLQKSMLIHAMKALDVLGKRSIQHKFGTYFKWGWSDEDALTAFNRQPQCMAFSDQQIDRKMDFFVNRMGWSPQLIAKHPVVLGLSLHKRIMPRCAVFQVLVSRNLVKEQTSIGTLLTPNEATFIARYVDRYLQTVPELMNVYRGKIDPSTLRNDESAPCKAASHETL